MHEQGQQLYGSTCRAFDTVEKSKTKWLLAVLVPAAFPRIMKKQQEHDYVRR